MGPAMIHRLARAIADACARELSASLRTDVAHAERARGLVIEWDSCAKQGLGKHYQKFADELREALDKATPTPEDSK